MPSKPLSRRRLLINGFRAGGGLAGLAASGFLGYELRGAPAPGDGASPTTTPPMGSTASTTTLASGRSAVVGPFISRSDLRPPTVTFTREAAWTAPSPSDGDHYFVSPKLYDADGVGRAGLMILDEMGRLVWFEPGSDALTYSDLQVQSYQGEPVLTWWRGTANKVHGEGVGDVADSHYRIIAPVRAGNGLHVDSHELTLTPQGTALITAYRHARVDLRSFGGPQDGVVLACQAQEIDVATGKMLFFWDSLDHVALTESYASFPASTADDPFDYFHINSISPTIDGNLLISARNTWALYKVNRATGEVMWRLNGKKSDFAMGAGTPFYWQHHSRQLSTDVITLFDDAADPPKEARSRGLILNVNEVTKSCSLTRAFTHPSNPLAANQGSMQVLADGRVLVGWGSQPYFSEFHANGELICDARFPTDIQSYRAFRAPWVGVPLGGPDVAARTFLAANTVYASWNGDTRTSTWRVLAGSTPTSLREVARAPRTGFETAISVQSSGPYFAVVAYDGASNRLGQSKTITV